MSRKLRILFDANTLTHQQTGIGFYTEGVLHALMEQHGDALELTGYYTDFLGRSGARPLAIPGVTYKPIRWFPRELLSLMRRTGMQPRLSWLVPSWRQYDVVLYPDFVALPTPPRLPSIVTIYDLCFYDHPDFLTPRNAQFLRRFVPGSVARAAGVLTDSEFTKDRLMEAYSTDSSLVRVAYPGVAVSSTTANVPPDAVQPVVYVGTVEPRKNLETLLQAYALLDPTLQRKHPLVLAGGKGWKNEAFFALYEKLVGRGLPIEYRGYVSDSEKAELYAQAAAVAVVSHYEGFGMQLVEAMRFDKPLLVSDIPVFREVAGAAATYCDPHDPVNMAQQLTKVLSGSSKAQRALYPQILERFTWAHAADTVFTLLQEMTHKP